MSDGTAERVGRGRRPRAFRWRLAVALAFALLLVVPMSMFAAPPCISYTATILNRSKVPLEDIVLSFGGRPIWQGRLEPAGTRVIEGTSIYYGGFALTGRLGEQTHVHPGRQENWRRIRARFEVRDNGVIYASDLPSLDHNRLERVLDAYWYLYRCPT